MPKVNPWSYPLDEPKRLARTLKDARKGVEVPFAVRELNGVEQMQAMGEAEEPIKKYVLGFNGQPPDPLLTSDGTVLDLTANGAEIISNACLIAAYQDAAPEDRYAWHEIIGFQQRLPAIYRQMQALVLEVAGETYSGNAPGAATGTDSSLP